MSFKRVSGWLLAGTIGLLSSTPSLAVDSTPGPRITSLTVTGPQKRLRFAPSPGTEQYKVFRTDDLAAPFVEDTSGTFAGFDWTSPLLTPMGFYRLQAIPMTPETVTAANILNRVTYGPTPDEITRVLSIGVDAYLNEQLAPESIPDDLDAPDPGGAPTWTRVVQTGTATSSTLYIYLSASGEVFLDDLKLVAGTNPDAGLNVLRNGDFETALSPAWTVSTNMFGSDITTTTKNSGNSSLRIVALSGGSSQSSSIYQVISPSLTSGATYTLSYYYLPATNSAALTIRLSNSGIVSQPDSNLSGISRRLKMKRATVDDLRAWYVMRAVRSKRQLLEVLTQFFENHFVTQYNKSSDYLDTYYDDSTIRRAYATDFEYRELTQWRNALLRPDCTFYDLLKISAESPTMIIYLDTVNSRGDGSNIANENYARELYELFTFGVDNGYDQTDIVETSKTWTGWRVDYVDNARVNDPFAPRSAIVAPGVTNNFNQISNLVGTWSFVFQSARHKTTAKSIFAGKTVPARFGAPWAGRPYALTLPSRTSTNGIQDGYSVLTHASNQPFTQEYLSVKLCRLFIHDDFAHGYDFTDPDLSAEGKLVKDCMLAWENSSPKGQIRPVLRVIFNSELFRTYAGVRHKVKTPLEFVVSAIRALRSEEGGAPTAETDGFSVPTALSRMGNMSLFNRDDPDGFPEYGPSWISAGTLAERLRWVQAFLIANGQSGRTDAGNTTSDPVSLLRRKVPQASWQDAGAVADFFLSILFLGEGRGNLAEYRTLAVNFLNTADNGTTASAFSALSTTGSPSPYDTRVRGMVGMLMTLPLFQEQ